MNRKVQKQKIRMHMLYTYSRQVVQQYPWQGHQRLIVSNILSASDKTFIGCFTWKKLPDFHDRVIIPWFYSKIGTVTKSHNSMMPVNPVKPLGNFSGIFARNFSGQFSLHQFSHFELKVFKNAKFFCCCAFIFYIHIFRFKMTLNLNFLVQGAVSFHPSVGPQNQPSDPVSKARTFYWNVN